MRRLCLIAAAATMVSISGASARNQPYIGEVAAFGFTFCPVGWVAADGALLAIADFSTLFSLVGTTYGGDGQTTFGVPKLVSSSAPSSQASATAYSVCIAVDGIFPSQN